MPSATVRELLTAKKIPFKVQPARIRWVTAYKPVKVYKMAFGRLTMQQGKVGDRVVVESERVGQPARHGNILEVLGQGESVHYRLRWEDGHESTFFPSAGNFSISRKAKKAR